MQNLWRDDTAKALVGELGVTSELAACIQASRLLGGDAALVLHGGGNTSVKLSGRDALGNDIETLHVKASGHDMADIGPAGFAPLALAPLQALERIEELDDAKVAAQVAAATLDPEASKPSVEVLLHAFLPGRHIHHTHSNALLALSNQPDGEDRCRDLYGPRVVVQEYAKSGPNLALAAAREVAANPAAEGLVLSRHGLVTWGDTAAEAYGRMIEFVSLAEAELARTETEFSAAELPEELASLAEVAPIVRGAVSGAAQHFLVTAVSSPDVSRFVNAAELPRLAGQGPATPDHVIHTKRLPLLVAPPEAGRLDDFAAALSQAVADYEADYGAYLERHGGSAEDVPDLKPRVILVPGLGLLGLGASKAKADMAADLYAATVEVISAAEALGSYQPADEAAIFAIEAWAPERAKLKRMSPGAARLAGHVAAVTGGASGIGAATARAFRAEGAEVAVLDLDTDAAAGLAAELGGLGLACDVTDEASVEAAFAAIAEHFGGLDIVVSNAGAAWQGEIGTVDEALLRKSFELNFWSHQKVAQAAVGIMRAQAMGGALLFNTSKQAINPGPDFGPYGLPKAATLFLMRQYAVDHGKDGIRANAVNADRIRSGLLTDEMIAARSQARGLSQGDYMAGNLLGREVTADDVAKAFVDLALSPKTTGAVITVDGGNIAAALR
ncbi:MAG TPA: bifunctional aldolase/short-chain dehydrogenase [Alphaproteobacteria bacterium]|jgi:rhamnose utilization protein RhaD (predicted bifunctional aldolase and dehydrogenase)/NAD(P)-dependent dehydrogenase (short-subunit alcohol dehydrogenase family)|nr:bifunctional aldolase/short-chain dehydrogenase [Alphaproteobacteria bacterium]